MIDALHISATGLRSQQEQIDVISNNVANMQTPGFKKGHVSFAEITGAQIENSKGGAGTHGGGSRVMSTAPVFSLGEFKPTQGATDVAIDGQGFFEVENENGERFYTRSGQFRVNSEGYLSSVNGYILAQNIQIPTDAVDLTIQPNGDVTVILSDSQEKILIGSIDLINFSAPDALEASGDNMFKATEQAGSAVTNKPGENGIGKLRQGYLEMANVNMVEEMSNLVLAQRAYQLNARVLQAADQVLETINNLRR